MSIISQATTPAVDTATVLYGTGEQRTAGVSVRITNKGVGSSTIKLAKTTGGVTPVDGEYLINGQTLAAGATLVVDQFTMAPRQLLTCEASTADISFAISGYSDAEVGRYEIARLRINSVAGDTANLAIRTEGDLAFDIDWGDGIASTGVASSSSVYQTHVYRAGFRGEVVLYAAAPCVARELRATAGRWAFDLAATPSGLTYLHLVGGSMTVSGTLGDAPSGLTYLYLVGGSMTVSGTLGDAPSGLTYLLLTSNLMTVSGTLGDAPSGLTHLHLNSNSMTVSGALGDAPSGLTYLYLSSNLMTVSGTLGDAPSGLTYLYLSSNLMTVSVSSASWPFTVNGFRRLYLRPDGLTEAEVDNALAAAANVTTWASDKSVDVAGNNAAPSAAGVASANTIIANGAISVSYN